MSDPRTSMLSIRITQRSREAIDVAQLLLGHSDVRTTERYVVPDESKVIEFSEMLG